MTLGQAYLRFFSQFGIPAYVTQSIPDERTFPYLTYTPVFGGWGDGPASITVNLWYNTEDDAVPNAKAKEIEDTLKNGGAQLNYDGGSVWLVKGSPWCQPIENDIGVTIKGRYINITAVF